MTIHMNSASKAIALLHGSAAGPALLEFTSRLVGPLQSELKGTSIKDLATKAGCQEGPVAVALRTCAALGYVQVDFCSGTCTLVQSAELNDLCRCLQSGCADSLRLIYAEASPPFEVPSGKLDLCVRVWSNHRKDWKDVQSKVLPSLLDGIVMVPIIASIACLCAKSGNADFESVDLSDLSIESMSRLDDMFKDYGLGVVENGAFRPSLQGQGLLQMDLCSRAASYFPLLNRLVDLTQEVPVLEQAGAVQPQRHVQDLMLHVGSFFSSDDFAAQPRFVVDTGCGDGSLLVRIYELVKETPRGKVLKDFPLTMVGVDVDEALLVLPKMNLCKKHIPHKVFTGDISNPSAIVSSMKQRKIDPTATLHVRICQDQIRRFVVPETSLDKDSPAAMFARHALGDVVHLDETGTRVSPEQLFSALSAHMERWAQAVDGSFGLCFSEEMLLDLPSTKKSWNDTACFHRDLLRSLSRRQVVPAAAVAMAAAMAGLFPQDVKKVQPYPAKGKYCETLNQVLTRRYYRIRFAVPADLPALERLEEIAWKKHMRAPREGLLKRLQTSPTTNLAVEIGGEVVAILYMQRIGSPEDVHSQKFQQVFDGASPDGRVLQLIAINAHTDHRGLGTDLRCFALHLARLDPTIDSVCAVTLCMDYASSGSNSLQEYVDKHLAGKVNDRILTFHTSYGANVLGLVPGYRPEDVDNEATGVLIQYRPKDWSALPDSSGDDGQTEADKSQADPKAPERGRARKAKAKPKDDSAPLVPTLDMLSGIMTDLGYEVDMDNLTQGFFSSGLDSFDMGVIQNRLSRSLGRQLPATLMLDLPNIKDLTEQLDKERGVKVSTVAIVDSPEIVDESPEPAAGRSASPGRGAEPSRGRARQRDVKSDDPIQEWVRNWRQHLYAVERRNRARSSSAGRRRSRSAGRRSRGPPGPWEKMDLEGLEKVQTKLAWILKLPHNQKRLQRVVDKQHEYDVPYLNDLRPALDSITGPVMLAFGLVQDTKPTLMQDARDDMELCAGRLGQEALARHKEIVKLMKLDHNLPACEGKPFAPQGPPISSSLGMYRNLYMGGQSMGTHNSPDIVHPSREPAIAKARQDSNRSSSRTTAEDNARSSSREGQTAKAETRSRSGAFAQLLEQLENPTDPEGDEEDEKALMEALSKLKGPLRQKLAKAALLVEQDEGSRL